VMSVAGMEKKKKSYKHLAKLIVIIFPLHWDQQKKKS